MELVFKLFNWKLDWTMDQIPELKQASHRWPAACAFMERDGEWEAIPCKYFTEHYKIYISWCKYLFHMVARNENGKINA